MKFIRCNEIDFIRRKVGIGKTERSKEKKDLKTIVVWCKNHYKTKCNISGDAKRTVLSVHSPKMSFMFPVPPLPVCFAWSLSTYERFTRKKGRQTHRQTGEEEEES
jgi:hypothetical protein